jgi:hypothetical protein
MSPTEEELREAERRGLDILCFVSKGPKDSDQRRFLDSLKSYEHGRMLAFYESVDELKDMIIQALNDLSLASSGGAIDAALAAMTFNARFDLDSTYGRRYAECRVAIIPEHR